MKRTALLLLGCALVARAQPARPTYQMMRYEEDWSFLSDPSRRADWWDHFKYIPLKHPGWYLTLGGELRERYELLDQPGFGDGPEDDNGYFLQRYLLSGDLHFGRRLRIFAELQSGLSNGRNGGPRPTDLDRLDIHQAFADWTLWSTGRDSVAIRIGRQEIGFGSGRLISPAEGLNVRRSMDGGRLTIRRGNWIWNATALRLVRNQPGYFDDVPEHGQTFWGTGVTAPHPFWEKANMSFYYMGLDRKVAVFNKGTGRAIRHTIGSRLWRVSKGWDYNYEAIFQWGSFREGSIRAWALSEDTGYTVESLAWRPRVGVRADIASGDSGRHQASLGSFDPLFAAAPVYSGPAGLLGPTNLIDVTPSLRMRPARKIALTIETSSFWRQSLSDGIYTPFLTPLRRSGTSDARHVATSVSGTLAFQATMHASLTIIYSRFFAGSFLRETPPDGNIHYLATNFAYRF